MSLLIFSSSSLKRVGKAYSFIVWPKSEAACPHMKGPEGAGWANVFILKI